MDIDSFSLKGKRALVTGSSRGIGRAMMHGLAALGADVVVHGIAESKASEEALTIARGYGVDAQFITGDLSAVGGGREFAERLLGEIGAIDIVVLNASVQSKVAWMEITSEEFGRQVRTNFQSSLEIIQTLAPQMQANGWGRILTVGSVQQIKPHPEMLVYAATKCAQMSMVTSLAKELASSGVTVNNLAPGVIMTDRNIDALADDDYAEQVKAKVPAGFFGDAADCVGIAQVLCSEAGRYITGQNIYADGGMGLS